MDDLLHVLKLSVLRQIANNNDDFLLKLRELDKENYVNVNNELRQMVGKTIAFKFVQGEIEKLQGGAV
jgi:hypothetical protein